MEDKILITGINGFVGKHLARNLAVSGFTVSGITREQNVAAEIIDFVHAHYVCDLVDKAQVNKLDLSPYRTIINLAGLANVAQSFNQPELYMKVNVLTFTNICQRVLEQRLTTRLITISTGAIYESNQPMPLTEASALTPSGSPYVQSKIAMEKQTESFRQKGLDCIIARPFNHIGPGQGPGFIVPDMYQKILMSVETGQPIKTGNLATRRDYTDVRDVVRAYSGLATADSSAVTSPIYNVCSGKSRSGNEILSELKKHMPGSEKFEILTDKSLTRPSDPKELVGNSELIKRAIGWRSQIPFEQTIADFVKSRRT